MLTSDLSIKIPGVLGGYRARSGSLKTLELPLEDVAAGRFGINKMVGEVHKSSTPPRVQCGNDGTGLELRRTCLASRARQP
jgi:hypothetical protein